MIGAGPVGVSKVLFARAGARVRRWRVARVMTVAGLLAVAALVTGCSGAGPEEVPTASGMPGGGVEPQVTPPSAPGGHWSDATAEDFGCAVGAMPGWAIEGGTGATPEEAVEELMGQFAEPMERAERAWVGYPDAAVQTWILGDERLTKVSAMVYEANGEYQASPDYICVETPWEETAFS